TEKMKEGDIDAVARKYGADFNAFTSHDMTSYYFECDKNNYQQFLPIFADCMQNAIFDDQHLASEVKAVVQELRMYTDNYWDVIWQHVFATLYPANHPYHHPIIGYKEDLADINGARLKAFYDKYYHPSRAVLCLVGDLDPQQAVEDAAQYFTQIPHGGVDLEPPFVPVPKPLKISSTTIYREVQHEQVGLYCRIPGLNGGSTVLTDAVQHILGTGHGSRLHRVLVDELQVAASVAAVAEQLAGDGVFLVAMEPKPGQRQACINAVHKVLEQVIREGVTETELYQMVKHRQRAHMQWRFDAQHFAYNWLESFYATGDEKELFMEANAYSQVTSEQVQAFAHEFLQPSQLNTVTVAPLAEEQKPLWQSQLEENEQYYHQLLAHHQRTTPLGTPEYIHTTPTPAPLSFDFPRPTKVSRQLEQTLTVITYEDHQMPLVSAGILFKDAAYLSRAKDGIGVDLMMALLHEQSRGMNKEQIVAGFDVHGAQYSLSGRGASATASSASFAEVFAHLIKVIREPVFNQKSFEKQRDIMIQSLEQGKMDPRRLAQRELRRSIYGANHPYGWSFDEAITYLRDIKLSDLQTLHDQYVRPDQLVLSVAGDVQTDALEQLVAQCGVDWQPAGYRPPVYPIISHDEPQNTVMPLSRDQVVLAFGRPSAIGLHDPEHLTLDVLSTICFYSLGSRIYALREQTGLFYAAHGAWATGIHQEHGYDSILAIINPDKVNEATQGIMDMIREVAENGVTEQEVAAARQVYLKDMIDVTTDTRSIAMMFANMETLGLGYDYYDKALKRVNALTAEEVSQAARDYASTTGFSRVVIGQEK
ncbi:MAG: pitrilysin family protein, partial [Candidatus Dependentiae bacterium]